MAKTESKGPKKGLIIAGAVIGALLAAYLGLCAWVGASGTVLPHVSVAGLDVSGLTAQQVQRAVEEQINGPSANPADAVELRAGGFTGCLGADCFQVDAAACAQAALGEGRETWIGNGFQYFAHLFGSQSLDAPGAALTAEGETELERLMDEMNTASGVLTEQADYRLDMEKGTLTFTKGVTCQAIDRAGARQAAVDAYAEYLAGGSGPVAVELITAEQPPQEPDFDGIFREIYREAEDAHMDPETYEITEGAVGVSFDVEAARAAFEAAGEGKAFTVPLAVTQPAETKESLEGKLFADVLGEGTTRVTGGTNRRHNVKTSAAACDGKILLPGEEFSYNNTTGSRSVANGYKDAPTYQAGQSVEGIGGGTCQVSSTIYYAVLHTTLEVTERHNHQFDTGYVDQGMDATVYFGSLDFRFKNSTDYPLKIVCEYYTKNGSDYLTVKLCGTNADGRYAEPVSEKYDRVVPTTVYKPKDSVPRGTLVLDREQYAYTGVSAHTYRSIYEADGTLVEKQDMGKSKYNMRPHTYYYNPLDGDPSTWVNGKPPAPETEPPAGGTTEPTEPAGPAGGGETTSPAEPGTGGETTEPGGDGGTPEPGTGGDTEEPGAGGEDVPPAGSGDEGGAQSPDGPDTGTEAPAPVQDGQEA